jgi:hypothetical protein
VQNAAPGAAVEVFVNDQRVATATADATATATLTLSILAQLGRAEAAMHIFVDRCDERRRVFLVEAGAPSPPLEGVCVRGTVREEFSIQSVTTLVVSTGSDTPSVGIRQGPAPRAWLGEQSETKPSRIWKTAPMGIIMSAGLGGANFFDAVDQACGDTTCVGQHLQPDVTAAATYWITRFLAVDVGYLRPSSVTASGSGTTFTFTSALDARVVTLDGKFGAQTGAVRLYGLAGMNWLSATSTTLQTATSTGSGAPETFAFKAQGWGWLGGAGLETWVTRRIGFYLEANLMQLKGSAVDNGQGTIDDVLGFATLGVRFAVGPSSKLTAR